MSNRIEFYKNRNISERFSVAIDFLKQNWKILYKNILPGGFPLAIIMAIIMTLEPANQPYTIPNIVNNLFFILIFFLVTFMNMVYFYSMTGALLHHYNLNEISGTTGWSDLKSTFLKLSVKTITINLVLLIPFIIIAVIIGVFVALFFSTGINSAASVILIIILILLLLAGLILTAPSFCMLYYPAFFSGKGIWESIKVSFVLGFRHWGSIFVALILTTILYTVVYMIFSAPFQILSLVSVLFPSGNLFILKFIFATLSTVGSMLSYPVIIIIFAFQYFSIVEKEESVSLQSQIDVFENL